MKKVYQEFLTKPRITKLNIYDKKMNLNSWISSRLLKIIYILLFYLFFKDSSIQNHYNQYPYHRLCRNVYAGNIYIFHNLNTTNLSLTSCSHSRLNIKEKTNHSFHWCHEQKLSCQMPIFSPQIVKLNRDKCLKS